MAINPYTYVNNIYNLKGQYENETDQTKRNTIANNAQQYYQKLRDNGYGYVADELQKSNYSQSKAINDKWSTYGKTPTRDYYYSKAKSRGLSQSDVDALIGWDNDTKELSFGGQKVGTPDAIVDGVGYWSEENLAKLDKSMDDYFARSGTAIPTEQLIGQNNTGVKEKIDEYWGTIKGDRDKYYTEYDKVSDYVNKDVTKTDEYQSTYKNIMGKYDMSAMQGRDNAIAGGSASNGGNIDSYAAANAMRQQTAITAEGQALAHQLGLGAYQARMDNARQLLSDLGIYQKDSHGSMENAIGLQQDEAQRLFENDETAKNNEVARLAEQAKVSGYTPNEWTIKNDDTYNQFLNPDGSFKSEMEGIDIQALINQAKARGDNDTANKLAVVRGRKILGNYSEFGQYGNQGDISFMQPQKTAEYDTGLKQIESAERISKDTNEAGLKASELEANAKLGSAQLGYMGNVYKADSDYAGTVYKADKDAEVKLKEEEKKQTEKEEKEKKEITEDVVTGWVNYFNNLNIERGFEGKMLVPDGKNKYKLASSGYFETVALHILSSTDLTINQKMYILTEKFGLTEDQINMVLNDKHYSK